MIETVPEVRDYQVYAGTASPINFNGLVRQYYLRSGPEQGDIQVNLVDKHERDRASHEIALDVRPRLAAIGKKYGASLQVVEVPPGPPVQAPIVAEIYGPFYDAQRALARELRGLLRHDAGHHRRGRLHRGRRDPLLGDASTGRRRRCSACPRPTWCAR